MPFCNQCGRALEPLARFCDFCGSNVAFDASSLPRQPMQFCDQCGRALEPFVTFCDFCGNNVTFVPPIPPESMAPKPKVEGLQDWSSYVVVRFPGPATFGPEGAEPERVESKPVEPLSPTQAFEAQPRPVRASRFHVTRRALALSAGVVALVVILTLAFYTGVIVLPPPPSTGAQTLSQAVTTQRTSVNAQTLSKTVTTQRTTVATQGTGPKLQVQVDVTQDPIAVGALQVIIVTVADPGGNSVQNASVHIEVTSPSGQAQTFDGSTDTNGQYSQAWHIISSPDNVGTFRVSISAAKPGYQTGSTQATFQATTG